MIAMNLPQRILRAVCMFAGIILAGTAGYMLLERWSFLDAIFMTVITITTVGFQEVHPLSARGQVFTIFLIIGGVGGALYSLTGIIEYVVEGHFSTTIWRRRMKSKIAELREHYILCGFGRVGQSIARTFQREGVAFVVIDSGPGAIANAESEGHLYIQGDATTDEVLKEAGIDKARGLVAALGTDVDNTYVTLSARELRPELLITARASGEKAIHKLERAGANHVVAPHTIGGRRMAMETLRPSVVDFIDTLTRIPGKEIQMESITASPGSPLVGLTVEALSQRSGAAVLAIQKKTDEFLPNPPGN